MDNKNIFAANLRKYMEESGKSRRDVCEALGFNYYTFCDWMKGRKYPRMDKVEILAEYFGIKKSDLIEEKGWEQEPEELADIAAQFLLDPDALAMMEQYLKLSEADKYAARLMIASLASKQKKTDAKVSQEGQTVSLSEIE